MQPKTEVLFIQGAGKGTHELWDSKLVASLQQRLGQSYTVHYPCMPNEDDPTYDGWKQPIAKALSVLPRSSVVVAHSIGGPLLIKTLTDIAPPKDLRTIIFLAAPFVGPGGWPADKLPLPSNLAAHLPHVPMHFFQGTVDQITPPAHIDLYARALPRACVHRLAGRDHQFNNELNEVAKVIRSEPGVAAIA